MVLADAAASPEEFGDTRVYRISGPAGDVDLTARRVTDSFAPTRQRLQAAIQAVTGAGRPDGVVLTGALSWLPLAAQAIAAAVGTAPEVTGCDAAARGALLFARGEVRLAPPDDTQTVTLPAHHIRDGLLEEFSVTLPWTAPFAALPGGALTDRPGRTGADGRRRSPAPRGCTAWYPDRTGSASGPPGPVPASSSCVPSPGIARMSSRSPA